MDLAKTLPIVDAYVMEKKPPKLPAVKFNHSTMRVLMEREHMFAGIIAGLLSNIESRGMVNF